MSDRVVQVLRRFTPNLEVYSIDESFLKIESVLKTYPDATHLGQIIKKDVKDTTGLPVCVGIGSSKTLAKFANHLAKKHPQFAGVCDVESMLKEELYQWMSEIPAGEVWGIGRQLAKKLKLLQINTVFDLLQVSPQTMRQQFGVVMERLCYELRGVSCLKLEEVAPAKQQIIASRSFGKLVTSLEELAESVATHAARAAEKLRTQNSVTGAISIFIETNPHKQNEPQYAQSITIALENPTDNTLKALYFISSKEIPLGINCVMHTVHWLMCGFVPRLLARLLRNCTPPLWMLFGKCPRKPEFRPSCPLVSIRARRLIWCHLITSNGCCAKTMFHRTCAKL
jgi:DNA polymerase V